MIPTARPSYTSYSSIFSWSRHPQALQLRSIFLVPLEPCHLSLCIIYVLQWIKIPLRRDQLESAILCQFPRNPFSVKEDDGRDIGKGRALIYSSKVERTFHGVPIRQGFIAKDLNNVILSDIVWNPKASLPNTFCILRPDSFPKVSCLSQLVVILVSIVVIQRCSEPIPRIVQRYNLPIELPAAEGYCKT